jgi:signal transduction histidine kinase
VALLRRAAERELEERLNSQASIVSTLIADELIQGQQPTSDRLGQLVPESDLLTIIDASGKELFRFGSADGPVIVGSAPGPVGTTVRIATSRSALNRRVRGPLVLLGGFAVLSIALGFLLARMMAVRLVRPLEQLAEAAGRLGSGDFSASVPSPSGVVEIDRIARALDASAHRLDQMLIAERSFTGDATHQLRTGLAGIGLQLELLAVSEPSEVAATLARTREQVDRMTGGLDELLALARGSVGQRVEFDLADLVAQHVTDWRARMASAGRSLEFTSTPCLVLATPGFAGQILDILLDNALAHGRGIVRVHVANGTVRVADAGRLDLEDGVDAAEILFTSAVPPTASHGRGLALARRMARADGGRLELVSSSPTVLGLSYPPSVAQYERGSPSTCSER